MCDWYSDEHGYLCYECYTELCGRPQDIALFMESEKMVDAYVLEDHMRRVERAFKRCNNE